MRSVSTKAITKSVKKLCIQANMILPQDLADTMATCRGCETYPLAQSVLSDLLDNLDAAKAIQVPICQDTGMAVVFVELGQDVHLVDGLLNDAIHQGVREGYLEGKLRCSVVADPLRRVNTNDNTPAIIHLTMVAGDQISITVAPKGFGSENMSQTKMFTPSATADDIVEFVAHQAAVAGSNPCPPMVIGVGIGGDFEKCALLSKQALCRAVSTRNPDPFYADLEAKMLEKVNELGIGPQGFGGKTTALAVNIEAFPTHIAGLPVAVNIGCHVTRHAHCTL